MVHYYGEGTRVIIHRSSSHLMNPYRSELKILHMSFLFFAIALRGWLNRSCLTSATSVKNSINIRLEIGLSTGQECSEKPMEREK